MVNTSSAVVRIQVTSFFSASAMAPSRFSGRQAAAVSNPMYRYTSGSSSCRISRSSRSTKNTVDTCCTVAVVTAPLAAVAAGLGSTVFSRLELDYYARQDLTVRAMDPPCCRELGVALRPGVKGDAVVRSFLRALRAAADPAVDLLERGADPQGVNSHLLQIIQLAG